MPNNDTPNRVNLKNVCVVQRGNKYYYPSTIPRERSRLSHDICLSISFGLFIADVFLSTYNTSIVIGLYVLGVLTSLILQILYRGILVVEESKHLTSRYGGSFRKLLKNAFHFSLKVWIALAFSVIYVVYFCCTNKITELPFNFRSLVLLLPSTYFLVMILDMETSPLSDSLWLAKDNGLDYGSGMAYSFFHGYLKLVLSKIGEQDKNLKEIMQDYEASHKIQFAIYKLFILIPKSLKCFESLMNDHSPSVDESSSLGQKIITVAGVKDRVYKNAVYKISTPKADKKVYVSAEYATPLRTFLEVVIHNEIHTEFYDRHKNDIILQFYLTLKKILEKTGLNEVCELIYYEDYPQDEEANTISYYDVGEIILGRLRELKRNAIRRAYE